MSSAVPTNEANEDDESIRLASKLESQEALNVSLVVSTDEHEIDDIEVRQ